MNWIGSELKTDIRIEREKEKNIEGITKQRHFQTHRFYCFRLVLLSTENN